MPRKLILAAIAVFMFLVIPFTGAYRAVIRGTSADLSPAAAARAAPAVAESTASSAGSGTIAQSASYLTQRLSEIGATAIVMQDTPAQIGYVSPAKIPLAVAEGLVPRVLWPGKPLAEQGYEFSQDYYDTAATEYSAAAITPQADLWRYGGWATVLAGMAFLGWLMRVADEVLDITDPRAAVLVLMLWPLLATPEDSFTGILTALPGLVVTWFVITAATFGRTEQSGAFVSTPTRAAPTA